jgi:hypothetical protein
LEQLLETVAKMIRRDEPVARIDSVATAAR